MKLKCYLVVQGKEPKYGPNQEARREAGAIRLTKTKPSTASDEIAVCLDMEIPDSLFTKPVLQAKVSVPEGTNYGGEIQADVADNIAEIIRQQTGFSVHISAEQDQADEDDS